MNTITLLAITIIIIIIVIMIIESKWIVKEAADGAVPLEELSFCL